MSNEIATDVALVIAGIEKLRNSFDMNDPLRYAKGDLRRAAEQSLRLAVAQAQSLIAAAETLQLNYDEAKASTEQKP